MVATVTSEERAAFKRCRRAWDFGAGSRRNLEPVTGRGAARPLDVDRTLRDALAVYYFPGMWDWPRAVVLPLVTKALDQSMADQREGAAPDEGAPGRALDASADAARRALQAYVDWAPEVERLAPVLVEADYEVDVPEPTDPEAVLRTPAGDHVRYRGRLDLLAMDEHDAYWIVRHHAVEKWTPPDVLVRDDELLTASWAWERFYIGMTITGTIHNELLLPPPNDAERPLAGPVPAPAQRERGGVPQHQPSGGGRSVPQHRRMYAQARESGAPARVVSDFGPGFRRTWIRRSPVEVAGAGRQLASEAREMFATEVAAYPSPSEPVCAVCPFDAPCLALYEGRDPAPILGSSYRTRPPEEPVGGRIGRATWSIGRGAAPPRFPAGNG